MRPTADSSPYIDAEQRFAIIPEWVLYHSRLNARAVRLYGILARHCDKEGRSYPSRSRLAVLLQCSRDTVDRMLQQLQDAQAVTWKNRTDEAGDPASNLYLLRTTSPGVAASMPLPGRTDAATGSRMDAAQKENQTELEVIPPTPRQRDELWDAMAEAIGRQPATSSERGRWNRAVKDIRDAGGTPADVIRRAAEYRRRWPRVECSPTAIATNWGSLATRPAGTVSRGLAAVEAIRRELQS